MSRTFGPETVLTNVDLSVRPGQIHGLIGPNGVGKTTLLRIISGLTDPSDGVVHVLGGAPTSTAIKTRIGWIPGSDRTFYLRLSGLENLIFFGRMYGLNKRQSLSRGGELLELVGLGGVGKRPTGVYSKGMLKRLAVARALLSDPLVLLCDETTHDLDPDGSTTVRGLVRSLAQEGMAVVWATQRLDELAGFAGSVTVLNRGGVAFSGEMTTWLKRTPTQTFQLRFGSEPTESAFQSLDRNGVRYTTGPDGSIEVEATAELSIGDIVTGLTKSGLAITSVNESESRVETAYFNSLDDTNQQ